MHGLDSPLRMTDLTTQLTAEEIREICKTAQAVVADWGTLKGSTSTTDYQVYRERIAEVQSGAEAVKEYYEDRKSEDNRNLGAVKLLIKNLERHSDLAKDRYWSLRRNHPSA